MTGEPGGTSTRLSAFVRPISVEGAYFVHSTNFA